MTGNTSTNGAKKMTNLINKINNSKSLVNFSKGMISGNIITVGMITYAIIAFVSRTMWDNMVNEVNSISYQLQTVVSPEMRDYAQTLNTINANINTHYTVAAIIAGTLITIIVIKIWKS